MIQFAELAHASGVSISWLKNTESDVAGYKVYYGTTTRNYQHSIDVGPFTSAVIDGLNGGVTYYFAVTAYDTSGYESAYSLEVQATIPVPVQPVILCSSSSLTTSCPVGNNASSQSFQIWNSGSGTLNYTISTNQTWLSCTPSSGSSTGASNKTTITFNYATSSLAPGTYSATIAITAPGASNTPQTIPVSLTVLPPSISCSTTSLTNSCPVGSNSSSQTFQVWNSGAGTLNYSISSNQAWLNCFPSSGSSTGALNKTTITVNYATSSLVVGSYTATITISAPGASNTPQTINVKINVLPPTISCSTTSLTNTTTHGNNAPSQTFQIWNSGAGTLNFTLSCGSTSWLSCTPSGTSTGTTDKKTITVFYTASNLANGTYIANITIYGTGASNTPQIIPVTLKVTSLPSPTIAHNAPATLTASCTQGNDPTSRSFDIWNSGGATLNYTISTNQNWLSCTPSGGTSTSTSGGSSHTTITVSFAASNLTPGGYSTTITINAPGATNTPQIIPVSLIVYAGSAVTPPAISQTPSSLTVSCVNGSNASSQAFDVWNSGAGTLNYSVYVNASWLSLSPSSGSSTGGHGDIIVTYATSDLAPGSYSASITISAPEASNNPQTIPVSLTVSATDPTPSPPSGSSQIPSSTPAPEPATGESTITILPTTLSVSCIQGDDAADQSFQIGNSGNGEINYTLTANADWITFTSTNGITTGGDYSMVTVHCETANLAVGEYDQIITVTSADAAVTNSPQTIPVHLTVKGSEGEGKEDNNGGSCFISTSTTYDRVFRGVPLFVLAGILLFGIARLRKKVIIRWK